LSFLATEPLRAYEERRGAKDTKEKTKDAEAAAEPDKADAPGKEDVGMMAGVTPGTSKKDDKKLLPATPWGRYVKILLSSSEFLFID